MVLSPRSGLCICPEEQLILTCQVSDSGNNYTELRINWWILFEPPDLSDMHQSYVSTDNLGDIQTDYRNDYHFTFNLTNFNDDDTSVHVLTSTLIIAIASLTSSNFNAFHTVTVDCNHEEAVLQLCTGINYQPTIMNQVFHT